MVKETKIDPLIEEDADADAAEVRVYELGFHLDGELGESEAKKIYQEIRTIISGVGEIVSEGEPTKIPLAYTISISNTKGRRDFNSAFFCWIAYSVNGTGHESIVSSCREETNIIRFIDIRTTKDEAAHSAQMHEIFAQEALQRNTPDEEEVSETELDTALKEVVV
jgi:ribosomal protein S6